MHKYVTDVAFLPGGGVIVVRVWPFGCISAAVYRPGAASRSRLWRVLLGRAARGRVFYSRSHRSWQIPRVPWPGMGRVRVCPRGMGGQG